VWQCRRTADFCADLRARGLAEGVMQATGLAMDPLFSASKIRWLLDQAPDGRARAERGELMAGTMDSWVLWNLTGQKVHACDLNCAGATTCSGCLGCRARSCRRSAPPAANSA
jgi:glycerol kinase